MLPDKIESHDENEQDAAETEDEEDEKPVVDELTQSISDDIDECLEYFDKDKMGVFDAAHLEKALKSLGLFLTHTEMKDLESDLSKDGK